MSNMSYVRHENTLADLKDVWYRWDEGATNEYEREARAKLIDLIEEMASSPDLRRTFSSWDEYDDEEADDTW
jgi:hypothetical protein